MRTKGGNMRKHLLVLINRDLKITTIPKLAQQIKIPYLTLWRIVKMKSSGNILIWEKIERYYR